MAKKILSVFIAALMIISMATVAMTSVSAADPSFSGGKIYWECPWDTAKLAYCHVYGSKGAALYDWQTKDEKMTNEGGNLWSYEIPAGAYDQVIFSVDTGAQTYDLVMTDDNIGDTAVTEKDNKIENPVDSNKSSARTTWKNGTNGPHLAVTSIGNIVGEVLCPTESGSDMVANFIINYITVQEQYVTEAVLKDAISKAGTTAEEVYAAVEANGSITGVAVTTEDGKEYSDALVLAAERLGISTDNSGSSDNGGSDNNSSSNNDTTGGTTSTSSTGGTRTNSSTTSTTSSGTTTTGDSTPFVVLGVVMVAALGLAVVAAKKKVSE